MKRYLFLMLAGSMICGTNIVHAQDIHFSQFYENAILRNPALTGIFSGDYKAGVNYRTQWSNISVPFQTVLASFETRVVVNKEVGDYISFGIAATYDKAGTINFNSVSVYPAINYNKALEDVHNSYLSFGFAGGYIQRSYDLTKATFSTQYTGSGYDPLASSSENITSNIIKNYDLAAGVSFNSSIGPANNINYYLGFAGYHLTQPRHSFTGDIYLRLAPRLVSSLGVKAILSDQYAVTAHLNHVMQGQYREIIGGGLFSWRTGNEQTSSFALHAGMFLRYKDALIPTVKLDYDQFSVTVSYDVNTSTLKPASNGVGGFEISLFMRGYNNKSQLPGNQLNCPRFEQMQQPTTLQY